MFQAIIWQTVVITFLYQRFSPPKNANISSTRPATSDRSLFLNERYPAWGCCQLDKTRQNHKSSYLFRLSHHHFLRAIAAVFLHEGLHQHFQAETHRAGTVRNFQHALVEQISSLSMENQGGYANGSTYRNTFNCNAWWIQ